MTVNMCNRNSRQTHIHTHYPELTWKNVNVLPPTLAPYFTPPLLLAKSSAFSMGLLSDSIVRKAAKFAVYEETKINVKNHQIEATVRVEYALETKLISLTAKVHQHFGESEKRQCLNMQVWFCACGGSTNYLYIYLYILHKCTRRSLIYMRTYILSRTYK